MGDHHQGDVAFELQRGLLFNILMEAGGLYLASISAMALKYALVDQRLDHNMSGLDWFSSSIAEQTLSL